MPKYPLEEIFRHIDFLFHNLKIARSVLPYVTNSMVGRREIRTPGYYKDAGYNATIVYDEPLTLERIKNINEASDSINQGFLIRLCAYLDSLGIYKPCINKNLIGHIEIDILRLLRNVFAHEIGNYNEKNEDHKNLFKWIIEEFCIPEKEIAKCKNKFPISIDGVIEPLIKGCKIYIIELNKNVLTEKGSELPVPEDL